MTRPPHEITSHGLSACPVCGSAAAFAFRSRYVDVGKCKSSACGHLHALSAAAADGVQTHTQGDADAAFYAERNLRLVSYWKARGFLFDGARVLDIGAGAGHIDLAMAVAMPSLAISCVEADPDSCRGLLARGFECHDRLDHCDGRFDAILLIEVIEHIVDPVPFLKLCAERLMPGGRIFLSTPCGETSKEWRRTNAYTTREHVQFFTEKSLDLACQLAGLSVLGYEAAPLYPRRVGVAGVLDGMKQALFPIRDLVRGRVHLISFLGASENL